MNNKFIFILGSTLLTSVSCNDPIKPVDPPIEYIEKTLEWDNSYYSYKQEGNLLKGTKYRFTSSINKLTYKYYYFGMCDIEETKPYFDIGYNDTNKTVNVTNIYRYNGVDKIAIDESKISYYSRERVLFMNKNIFTSGDSLIIECTITEDLSNGIWVYTGSGNG